MSSIVYIHQSEFDSLLKERVSRRLKGVAFGWESESVFHLFIDKPDLSPGGYPLASYFFIEPVELSTADVESLLEGFLKESEGNISSDAFVTIISGSAETPVIFSYLLRQRSFIACSTHCVPLESDLFSRSKGLLESSALKDKRVSIIGLGSFGSSIAVELAKSGVGHFSLFDFDRIELSNIARHVCGINDLGRYKTKAIRDALLLKNPYVCVDTFELDINESLDVLSEQISKSDLAICVTDENRSRFNINDLVIALTKPALFGRAITRAAGGDVFHYRPSENGPCLACLFGQGLFRAGDEVSGVRQVRRDAPAYLSPEQANAMIQAGLSVDIAPIVNMLCKLALLELSKGTGAGIESLKDDLTSSFYIWANRRELIYENWPAMEHYFNKNSILRWYGVKTFADPECLSCNL